MIDHLRVSIHSNIPLAENLRTSKCVRCSHINYLQTAAFPVLTGPKTHLKTGL